MISRRVGTQLQGFDRFRTIFVHGYRDSKASEKYLHTVTGMRRDLRDMCTPLQGIECIRTAPGRNKQVEVDIQVEVPVDVTLDAHVYMQLSCWHTVTEIRLNSQHFCTQLQGFF